MYKIVIYSYCLMILIYVKKQICLADFSCLCNYAVETPVHSHYEVGLLGYMYEYDCKELLPSKSQDNWTLVAFEHKVGYVNTAGVDTAVNLCQGDPSPDDILLTSTTTSAVSTKNGAKSMPTVFKPATTLTTSTPKSDILTVLTSGLISSRSAGRHTPAPEMPSTTRTDTFASHEFPNLPEKSTRPISLLSSNMHTKQISSEIVSIEMRSLSTADIGESTTTMESVQSVSTVTYTKSSSVNQNQVTSEMLTPFRTSDRPPISMTTPKTPVYTNYFHSIIATNVPSVEITEPKNKSTSEVSTEPRVTDFLANNTTSKPFSLTEILWNATDNTASKYHVSAKHTSNVQGTIPSVSLDTIPTPYSTTDFIAYYSKRLAKQTTSTKQQTAYVSQTTEPLPLTDQSLYNKTDGPISGRTDLCPYHVLAMTNYTKATGYVYMRQLGQYCYEFRPYLADWYTARKDCIARSGDMVVVDELTVHQILLQMLKELTFVHEVWIGLHDIDKTGAWRWTNGKTLTASDYKAWMPRSMDVLYGHLQECVKMDAVTGRWTLAICDGYLLDKQKHPWICQYKIS